jgi:hypothetical protein
MGERSVSGPRFPLGLRGATTAYVASASTDAAARRAPPVRHTSAVRDPSASAADESSHGSADELPPATSHGYVEWDFSGVLDPVMFRRFLDAADYWSGSPTTPVPEATIPCGSASWYSPTTRRAPRTRWKPATGSPRPVCGANRASPLTAAGGRHQRAIGLGT